MSVVWSSVMIKLSLRLYAYSNEFHESSVPERFMVLMDQGGDDTSRVAHKSKCVPGTSDQTGLNRDDLWSSDSNFLQGDSKLDTDDSYLRKGVTFSNAVC